MLKRKKIELLKTSNCWVLSVHLANTTENISKINMPCALTV